MSNTFALFNDEPEASLKELKATLIIAIITAHRESGKKQHELAEILKISQPRVSNLLKGMIDQFSLDTLVIYAERLNIKVDFRIDYATLTPDDQE